MRQRPPRRDITNLTDLRAGLYCRVSRDDDDPRLKDKSPEDQEREGRRWAARVGAVVVEPVYREKDSRSASRFATKEREEFTRLLGDIKRGQLDVVWFWELSRSQRDLKVYIALRDLCRDHGVLLAIGDRIHDPADYADMVTPSILSVMGELESEQTSKRVLRGKESAARQGNRAGHPAYGYRPVYDPATGRWARDEPNVENVDGSAVEDSPAGIVREIFERIRAGHSMTSIRRDLNDRGIPSPWGKQWGNSRIRYIAMSPTYIGQRVYQGEDPDRPGTSGSRIHAVLDGVQAKWPPLVDEETFWMVHAILNDPARTTTRTHRPGGRLLSAVARCGVCGGKVQAKRQNVKQGQREDTYACKEKSCVGIYISDLDGYVEEVMKRWFADPQTAADLTAARTDDAVAGLARADLGKAKAELEEWRQLADGGQITAVSFARFEQGALARIADAAQRVADATLPPVLAGNLAAMAEAGWDALDRPVKRQIIAAVADIRVLRVGKHGNRQVAAADRVAWRWLLGPDAGQDTGPAADEIEDRVRAARAAELAERREKVTHLRSEGLLRREIAEILGLSVSTVQKDLSAMGAGPARLAAVDSRRTSIEAALRADPETPDRLIARQVGMVDRHLIRATRREMEEAGEIPSVRRAGRGAPQVRSGTSPTAE